MTRAFIVIVAFVFAGPAAAADRLEHPPPDSELLRTQKPVLAPTRGKRTPLSKSPARKLASDEPPDEAEPIEGEPGLYGHDKGGGRDAGRGGKGGGDDDDD